MNISKTCVRIFLIFIMLLSIALISYPATAAETFNESFSFAGGETVSDSVTHTGAGSSNQPVSFPAGALSNISVNFDNIKTLTKMVVPNNANTQTVSLTSHATGSNSNYTSFTAVLDSDKSFYGSGTIGWERTTGTDFNYVLYFSSINSSDSVLTGSQLMDLVYDTSVYSNDLAAQTFVSTTTACGFAFTCAYVSVFTSGSGTNTRIESFGTYQTSFSFADHGVLTFNDLGTGFGFVNVTKFSFNMSVNITNTTQFSYYNNISVFDVSHLTPEATGINVSIQDNISGFFFNRTLVNSTGVPQPVPTATPPPGLAGTNTTNITKPSSGANVAFDKSSYLVGDNVNISWFLSDSTQADIFNKCLVVSLNGIPINTNSCTFTSSGGIGISQQNGFYIYQANASGTLTAAVQEGFFTGTTIGSGTVIINPPGGSWIAITNTTMYARQNNTVTYHIGYSVANYPAAAIEIDFNDIATGNLVDEVFPTIFPDGNMTFGVVHPIPIGNYSARLIDSVKNQVLDTKYFTAIQSPIAIPPRGIATSSISTDKATYFYNDFMTVNYQVDDTNFSNQTYMLMGHVYNSNNVLTKMFITPFADQVGTFDSIINLNKNQKCDKGLNCWFDTGNNNLTIVLMNNSGGVVFLANTSFIVSSTTVDGYGLTVSTNTPTSNVVFTATATIPAGHVGFLSVSNAGTKKTIFVYNQTVGNLTSLSPVIQTFPITIAPINSNPVAYYEIDLVGDDNITKVAIPLTVSQTAPQTWTGSWTAPQGNIGTTCSAVDGWVNLMFGNSMGLNDVSRQAFAFTWIVAVVFLLVVVTKNIGIGIVGGFLPWAYFLILSLTTPCGTFMPTWTAVFLALIVAVKMRWF